jgi:hypothetical protein
VNGYLRLWLACPLLSACCCWRLYLCRSQEWAEHSPSLTGFVYSEFSWAQLPVLRVFPSPSPLGEVVLCSPSPASVFIYSSPGKCPFPPVQWGFPHTATFTSFPAPRLLGGCRCSCLLWPTCLFTVLWGIAPPRLWRSEHPALFATCLFVVVVYSVWFFSFFPGWGSVCPGGYADLTRGCLWEYHVPLSSPGGLLLLSW